MDTELQGKYWVMKNYVSQHINITYHQLLL